MRWAILLLTVLTACNTTTEPHPLPLCVRKPLVDVHGDTVGYTIQVQYIGKVATCRVS